MSSSKECLYTHTLVLLEVSEPVILFPPAGLRQFLFFFPYKPKLELYSRGGSEVRF